MQGLISAPNKLVSIFPPPSLLHQSPKPAWPRLSVLGVCARSAAGLTHPHRVLRQRGGRSQFPTGH